MITLINVLTVNIVFVDFVFVNFMFLTSFFVSKKIYNDAKLLIKEFNKHAESESYAVVIARFKKFKKNVNRLVYIRCDREKKASLNSASFKKRLHSNTRLMKCFFSVVNKRNEKNDWYFKVIRNENHNYTFTLVSAHSALRRLIITEKVRKLINFLIKVEIRLTQIFTHLRLNVNQKNSFFTRHDVYNVKNH